MTMSAYQIRPTVQVTRRPARYQWELEAKRPRADKTPPPPQVPIDPTYGDGTTLAYKGRSIRALPVDGVPWFGLPDLADSLGLSLEEADKLVHSSDFPAHARLVCQESPEPDPEITSDPGPVTLLSPTGVWWLTALMDDGAPRLPQATPPFSLRWPETVCCHHTRGNTAADARSGSNCAGATLACLPANGPPRPRRKPANEHPRSFARWQLRQRPYRRSSAGCSRCPRLSSEPREGSGETERPSKSADLAAGSGTFMNSVLPNWADEVYAAPSAAAAWLKGEDAGAAFKQA